MECSDNNNTLRDETSVVKSAVQGAAIGAVLWPSLGLAWDAFSKNKTFVAGNRIRFITSQATMGALVNGVLNGALAWWQNRGSRHSHVEAITEQRQQVATGEQTQRL